MENKDDVKAALSSEKDKGHTIERSSKKPKLIKATQGGVIRSSSTAEQSETFLFTDNLRNCLCICIIGNNGKVSLSHIDSVIEMSSLAAELDWVGAIKKIIIVNHKILKDEPFMERIYKFFKEKGISFESSTTATGLSIFSLIEGKRMLSVELKLTNSIEDKELNKSNYNADPEEENRHAIIMLNNTLGHKCLHVQYENGNWTPLPVLIDEASKLVNKWNENPTDQNNYLKGISLRIAKENKPNATPLQLMNDFAPIVFKHLQFYLTRHVSLNSVVTYKSPAATLS